VQKKCAARSKRQLISARQLRDWNVNSEGEEELSWFAPDAGSKLASGRFSAIRMIALVRKDDSVVDVVFVRHSDNA